MNALISVFHKEGVVEFARELLALDWRLFASGGTAKTLAAAGLPVTDVAELVGGGPILGHRVVTLSREVHAGLLATDSDADIEELEHLSIPRIDLVYVDLYPLKEEIAKPNHTWDSVIDKTDIGGPTMLRSAAKGGRIVVCDPGDRAMVIEQLKQGQLGPGTAARIALAAKAEMIVADYCLESAHYHSNGAYDGFIGQLCQQCKYGENAWQTEAALFGTGSPDLLALDKFQLVAGSAPSYNNLADVDRLLQTVTHIAAGWEVNFSAVPFIAVAVKHGNPCGAAVAEHPSIVLRDMIEGDTRAIFGGLVMTNFKFTKGLAEVLLTHKTGKGERRILDGIIAPSFHEAAIDMLKRKGDKCRFLANPALAALNRHSLDTAPRFRYVRGGFLHQPNYTFVFDLNDPNLQQFGTIDPDIEYDLLLAWAIGSTSNSNTITLVKDGMLIGNGTGQQDRVGAAELAIKRARDAGHVTEGVVAYSDSFFPFPDAVEVLAKTGIKAILTSSGSKMKGGGDPETIRVCQENGIVLYMMPDAIGRGFFGH